MLGGEQSSSLRTDGEGSLVFAVEYSSSTCVEGESSSK